MHQPESSPTVALRTRDLPAAGLTRDQVRGPGWVSPTRGVYQQAMMSDDLRARCGALQLVLPPHAVFTHLTAAALRGWWLPVGLAEVPIIVSTEVDAPHHDRRGVYVRRCDVPPGHRTELDAVRVASAAWTIAELAEHLSLIDLVAVIDCARHRGEVNLSELWDVCVKGRRGVRTLRRAIRLSDGRSESFWETVLRLLHVMCDITDVEPQATLVDADGRFVARADLRIGRTRRLHEFDGGVHRERDVHEHDLDRDKRLARAGWDRRGYTSRELVEHPMLVLRDAEHALGLAHDPSRLVTWQYEAQRSSITPEGRRALHRRLRRFVRATPPRRRAAHSEHRTAQSGADRT